MKCLRFFLLSLVLSNTLFAQTNFEFNFKLESRPAVRLDYGFDYSSLKEENKLELTNTLTSLGIALGMSSSKDIFPAPKKIKYGFSKDTMPENVKQFYNAKLSSNSFWGLDISFIMGGNGGNPNGLFVIGPIALDGAGYKFADDVSLKLLTGSNITWYWLDGVDSYDEPPPFPDPEDPIPVYSNIEKFGTSVRFGSKYQSEISFQFMKNTSIYVGANRLVVFPRTLFWKWAGSDILYGIGGEVLSYFTGKIKTSSPYVYPAVEFILRTGLYFGITELQKKNMNFPYKTAAPLMIEQYKIGLQFDF